MLEHGLYGLVRKQRTGMLGHEYCTSVHKLQAFLLDGKLATNRTCQSIKCRSKKLIVSSMPTRM